MRCASVDKLSAVAWTAWRAGEWGVCEECVSLAPDDPEEGGEECAGLGMGGRETDLTGGQICQLGRPSSCSTIVI